jgi:hypothetical protein
MRGTTLVLCTTLLLGSVAEAFGARLSFQEHAAVQESLSRVHPRMRASWLRERGIDDSYYTTFHTPESTGLACIGRWPWGPSWELAGRDTFLYLGSGSGVRILSIADSVQPRMLGQINARGLVSQVVVRDSLLFVACGSWGAQIYSVSDPSNPRELGSMDAVINDVCVKDSLCYALGGDSLRVYSVARPGAPAMLGAATDSGMVVAQANGYAYCGGDYGLNVYDVRDPGSPARVNSRGGPYYAMFIRRSLLFCTGVQPDYMSALNISDPLNITQVSTVNGYGGDGLYVDDSYAYLSCNYEHEGLFVVDVGDSSRPTLRDSINPEGVPEWDPYVPHSPGYGYLADDFGGSITLDLHDADSILAVWSGYKASQAVDVWVEGQRAYVANEYSGLQIITVADPAKPVSLGIFDTIGTKITYTAAAQDSFAFAGMSGMAGRRYFVSLDVFDPTDPVVVARESCRNPPQDMVLRDTLLYCAEMNQFQVFNVARPREPVRVGSCVLNGDVWDLDVEDSTAYVTSGVFTMINVARPDSPRVVATWNPMVAVDAKDTIAYLCGSGAVWSLNVANPASPYVMDTVCISGWVSDIVVGDTLAFAGGAQLYIINISDPANLRVTSQWTPPHEFRQLLWTPAYLYAACYEAGICVLETLPVGLEEPPEKGGTKASIRLLPTVTAGPVSIMTGRRNGALSMRLYDEAGVRVGESVIRARTETQVVRLDLSRYPDGVYFVCLRSSDGSFTAKVVKAKGR